ncbi:M50 family metallopeptidase [Sphingomonas sp. AR_OL41]|uniref:M50 family metallopeptidase n=1 Tax=Sphingomonas sp. AR_OL41 TaxID=3042729 RepID=UPI002480C42A|nr:M50 family metallopeptidase [Sphingomonas sp. AR_OL41]MDH7974274.1 M50 family metallopeptidase [Sphingomonas sp. AR_OL41]
MTAAARRVGRSYIQAGSLILLLYALLPYCIALGPLAGVPIWYAGNWLATIFHEAGHALAARACSWRTIVFVARPFGLHLPHRDIVIVRRTMVTASRGWLVSVPGRPSVATRGREALYIAGGPVASLLLAAVATWVSIHWRDQHGGGESTVSLIAVAFALQSLRGGIFTLLPSGVEGGSSDGQKLWRLRRDDGTALGDRALRWISVMLYFRIRLRDLPPWMLDAARSCVPPGDDAMDETARALASIEIGIELDAASDDVAQARRMIDAYRARYGASEWLNSVDAFCAATWEADAKRARATLWCGPHTEALRAMVMAAEAAVAAREGDAETARSRLSAMRQAVKADSPFHNATFRDIGQRIEAMLT